MITEDGAYSHAHCNISGGTEIRNINNSNNNNNAAATAAAEAAMLELSKPGLDPTGVARDDHHTPGKDYYLFSPLSEPGAAAAAAVARKSLTKSKLSRLQSMLPGRGNSGVGGVRARDTTTMTPDQTHQTACRKSTRAMARRPQTVLSGKVLVVAPAPGRSCGGGGGGGGALSDEDVLTETDTAETSPAREKRLGSEDTALNLGEGFEEEAVAAAAAADANNTVVAQGGTIEARLDLHQQGVWVRVAAVVIVTGRARSSGNSGGNNHKTSATTVSLFFGERRQQQPRHDNDDHSVAYSEAHLCLVPEIFGVYGNSGAFSRGARVREVRATVDGDSAGAVDLAVSHRYCCNNSIIARGARSRAFLTRSSSARNTLMGSRLIRCASYCLL